jgi:anhydro-N-acetylmuramic acid kinase
MIIAKEGLTAKPRRLFVTGGGALNTFLMQRIAAHCEKQGVAVIIPSKDIVQFKEALLMGVLGFLRVHNVPNTLSTVTGAKRDTIGGALHKGS